MPANIVKAAEHFALGAREENALARHLLNEVIARLRNLTLVTGTDPLAGENFGSFLGKNFRRNEIALGQSSRAGGESLNRLAK
jgi:hypothetical protein